MSPPSGDHSALPSQGTLSTGAKASFQRGPAFTLETFSSKDYIVKDFIESLSESSVPTSRRSGPSSAQGAFDPKPLIRTFEHALSRLGSLSDDLEIHETDLSASVRRAESQHNQNIDVLGKKLEQAVHSFHQLDSSLNNGNINGSSDDVDSGGNIAVRIGEKLEELDRQRQRAQDARFLIQCWNEVTEKGSLSLLEDMRRSGTRDGKVRCAHIARQLLKISQRLEADRPSNVNGVRVNGMGSKQGQGKSQAKEIIEKFLEMMEKDLLKQFDGFYRKQNFEGMRECAVALKDFNDGGSVMALFVNQHQFFIDRSQLITEEVGGDGEAWDRLADPDTEPPGVEPSLQSLVDEVKLVVQEESFIIKRAFPFAEEVLIRFLQRIFQQSIQQRLEMVLEKASSISSLAFLRSLQTARSYIGALVDDMKTHGLIEHPEPVSGPVATVLDQQLDDLFVPYFAGSSYIEREKKNLEELYSSLLLKFTIYHSKRRKMPTGYFGSLGQKGKELFASARDAYMERLDSSDLPASQKAMLIRIAGLKDADSAMKNKGEIEVSEEDGQLNVQNVKRMLKWMAEGVGRGLELSGGNETPKDVQALLGLLLSHVGAVYLEGALDSALDLAASQENARSEPDVSYLPGLRTAISTLHLLQTSITTVLLPLASPNLTIRREIEKTTNSAMSGVEAKISGILQRTLDVALSWVTRLLAQQKKSDFRPRDDTASAALIDALQTPACNSVAMFLSKVASLAAGALDGKNLASFLAELATGLRTALLDHFRRFTVSLAGGLVVSKDVTKYSELVRGWPMKEEFKGGMDVLVEISNLYVIGPEALRERLRNAQEAAELRAYVLKREDSGSVGVQSVLNSV